VKNYSGLKRRFWATISTRGFNFYQAQIGIRNSGFRLAKADEYVTKINQVTEQVRDVHVL
jgi:hypothetical protein